MSSADAAGPPPAQGGGIEEDVKADAVVGEGGVGAEETLLQQGGAGTKRPAEEGDGKVEGEAGGVSKRAKAMPIAGGGGKRRVVKLTGLDGLYWDQLDGQLRKWAIPFCNLVKKQMQDTAQLELPDDRPILMGCLRVMDNQTIKGKVIKVNYEGLEDVKPPSAADENEESARGIVRQVAPLFDVEYEDQLTFKKCLLMSSMRQVTVQMHKELVGKGNKGNKGHKGNNGGGGKGGGGGGGNADDGTVECPKWVWRAHKGPCLDVGEVHRSPALTGYRNKNEFTIGHGPDGKPEVGFRFGKFTDGRKGVGCADACPNIPESALAVARCLKDFIVNHQDMSPWINDDHKGVWRMLLVRSSRAGDVMAMVQYSSNNVEREKLDAGLEKMKHFLLEKVKGGKMKLTCLYGQEHNTVSNKAADDCPLIHMWGEECFYENLLSLRFRISPSAFFQVNTLAAEVLNGLIRDWAAAGTDQVVLDVCCGTGTIGMCIASHAKQIVGIELCEPAVVDARTNAAANGIENCTFMAGRAEDKIRAAIEEHVPSGMSCVAVLDPPREGCHKNVLRAIRATKEIERIVYVSCDHTRFVEQAIQLCSPSMKYGKGDAFEPVMANGIDLFPHTAHVELMVLLERGATLEKRRQSEAQAEEKAAA